MGVKSKKGKLTSYEIHFPFEALFLRRFLTTFKRLERLFSQPIFTSVLYNINTRDNTENQDLTTKPRKKIALIPHQFPQIVTLLQ